MPKRKAERRAPAHQQVVQERRRSSAAQPHRDRTVYRRTVKHRAKEEA